MTTNYECKDTTTSLKRLKTLYETIEKTKPCNFDITVVTEGNCKLDYEEKEHIHEIIDKKQQLVCGSAACVFGHFPVAFRNYYRWNFVASSCNPIQRKYGDASRRYDYETSEFLGIDIKLAKWLTVPEGYPLRSRTGVKGQQVALKRLTKIIKIMEEVQIEENLEKELMAANQRVQKLIGQIPVVDTY